MIENSFFEIANVIIVLSCYIVYKRTRNMYDISMQKGLLYFSSAFLAYIISFATRLIGLFAEDLYPEPWLLISLRFVSLFGGALGGLYLAYSLVWRKFEQDQFRRNKNKLIISLAVLILLADLYLSIFLRAGTAYVLFTTMIVILLGAIWLKRGRASNPYVSSVGLGFVVYVSLLIADLFSPILGTVEFYMWGMVTIFFVAVAHNVSGCCK